MNLKFSRTPLDFITLLKRQLMTKFNLLITASVQIVVRITQMIKKFLITKLDMALPLRSGSNA